MEVVVECLMSVVLVPMVELMSAANRIQALSLLLPEPTLHRPESDQTERIYLFERTVWPSIIQREQFTVLNASHPSVRCANIMAGPSFCRSIRHRTPNTGQPHPFPRGSTWNFEGWRFFTSSWNPVISASDTVKYGVF